MAAIKTFVNTRTACELWGVVTPSSSSRRTRAHKRSKKGSDDDIYTSIIAYARRLNRDELANCVLGVDHAPQFPRTNIDICCWICGAIFINMLQPYTSM